MMASEDQDNSIGFAQDLICCDLCKSSVELHCNTCSVSLCNGCVGKHISSHALKQHDITLFRQRKSTLLLPLCDKHTEFSCDFYCLQCEVPTCPDCITGSHKKHDIAKMSDTYNSRKLILQKETEFFETVIYPEYVKADSKMKKQISEQQIKFENIRNVIKKNGEEWHKMIDVIIQMNLDEIDLLEHDNIIQLQKNSEDIEGILSSIRKQIDENNRNLHSLLVTGVLKYQSVKETYKSPKTFKARLTAPVFLSPLTNIEGLKKEFGKLTTSAHTEEITVMKTEQPEKASFKVYTQDHIKTLHLNCGKLYRVCFLDPDEFWISGPSREIYRVNENGFTVETFRASSSPADITVNAEGNLVYTSFNDSSVMMKRGNNSVTLKRFDGWNPTGICYAMNGDCLLFLLSKEEKHGKVVRFKESTLIKEIEFDENNKPVFPYCPNGSFLVETRSKDICVSENISTVIAFDHNGKFKWRYYGFKSLRKNRFSPRCISSNTRSEILVTDFNNDCVHIIDANGNFLRYIDVFGLIAKPCGLTLGKKGQIWIGELESCKLKCIKYMS